MVAIGIVGALIVVGLGLLASALKTQEAAEMAAEMKDVKAETTNVRTKLNDLRATLTGANSYGYVHSRAGQKKAGNFLLDLQSFGKVSDVKVGIYRIEDGGKQTHVGQAEVDLVGHNVNFGTLPSVGKWRFSFVGPFFDWNQVLVLEEKNGILTQNIEVRHVGKTECLYCPKPQQFKVEELGVR